MNLQTPRDPSAQRWPLVIIEIVPGANLHQGEHVAQPTTTAAIVIVSAAVGRDLERLGQVDDSAQLLWDFSQRQHQINQAAVDRTARHGVVLGFQWVLHDGNAAHFLDALQAERAVAARARQHDRDRFLAVGFSQTAKEQIDRDAPPANVFGFDQPQLAIL